VSPLSALSTEQRHALDLAVELVSGRYAPWAIVAAGTLIQGVGDGRSDIDLYVLHDQPFRQRIQRTFGGVPVEIFVNPESAVLRYFDEEAKDGRPLTAHMLATGVALLGRDDPRFQALRERARARLESRPSWTAAELTQARYGAATLVEDALDRRSADPETAMRLLGVAMSSTLSYWFKRRSSNIPRAKEILPEVDRIDPELGRLFRAFWGDGSREVRWTAALSIADRVLETRGFFDWESEPQDV